MSATKFQESLKNYNISILNSLSLDAQEELELLKKIEKLKEHQIIIPFINEELVEIILNFESENENYRDKLSKINWKDFEELFAKQDRSKREEKIYSNFIEFLKSEFGMHEHNNQAQISLIDLEHATSKNKSTTQQVQFEPQDQFDYDADLHEKCTRFNVEVPFNYTQKSRKLNVNDFILYFNQRLAYFTGLLKGRVAVDNLVSIHRLRDLFESNTQVSVIGLVSEIQQTKNGHTIVTLEDKTGLIKCFIHKDKSDLIKEVESLCLDEGIAIVGKVGKDIIWTDEIIIPSPPVGAELNAIDEDSYVICLSDIHFGAKVFVDEAFQKLVDWLKGETQSEELNELARKVKYVIIAGDIIEGIGIYPNQGKDARILSTQMQYHEAARWLSQIPNDKCIIAIPGNHDTDRLSEPQPPLPYEKAYALYNMNNVIMLSNPAQVRLFSNQSSQGLLFHLYHGGSIFYYADKMTHLREKGGAKVPEEVIKFLLEKRHLAPSHGSTLYIPDSTQDPLVIKTMPDFFITGHTHKLSLANYKGCTIVSCGCWVEMSDYQEKMGMFPDIGKCTVLSMKSRKPKILNFYTENYKKEKKKE